MALLAGLGGCYNFCDYGVTRDPIGLPIEYDADAVPADSVVWVVHGGTAGTLTVDGEPVTYTVTALDHGGALVPDQPWVAGDEVAYAATRPREAL